MAEKTAVIISKNQKLYDYIESELVLWGYSIKNPSKNKSVNFDTLDILIYDATNMSIDNLLAKPRLSILITSEERASATSCFDKTLKYPFLLEELRNILISSDSLQKKAKKASEQTEKIIYLDKSRNSIIFKNTSISLSDYELRILKLLCENSGKCVARDELSKCLGSSEGNIANVYICHLRQKLEKSFGVKVIYTVRSKGFMTDYLIK